MEQLIIAGNSVPQSPDVDKVCRGSFRAEKYNKAVYEEVTAALDLFEGYLKKLLSCCRVTIMPGIGLHTNSTQASMISAAHCFLRSHSTLVCSVKQNMLHDSSWRRTHAASRSKARCS